MKVLIVGGGIGGIVAALCLNKSGHQVEVFEQAANFTEAGAGIQLSPNASRVLHHLGLEDALKSHGFLPEGNEVRAWNTGKLIMSSELGDEAVQKFGFPYYHIHRGDLLNLLVHAAEKSPNVALHTNAKVRSFDEIKDGVRLQVNGKTHDGDLLVGADGIHSLVRSRLWGDEQPNFTGNIAWRALVPVEELPANLIKPVSSVWWGPGKHFVHYYVRSGEMVNCVCVVEKDGWVIESWTERGDYEELKSDFRGWHQSIQTLIDAADRESLYKWALYDRPPMTAWSRGRVTLLGDACHPTLPFMAQGAAMAIEDGAALDACLQPGVAIPQALARYENLRRERTANVQAGSRRNAAVFHLSGIKAWIRNKAAKTAGSAVLERLYRYNVFDDAAN